MVFFLDFNISKDKKIGITNLLGNITTKPHSHKGGWAKLLRCQLVNEGYINVKILDKNDKLDDFDCIIFDLGAEFNGGLNLFGGLNSKVYVRLKELKDFPGKVFSWQHELPFLKPLESRRKNASTCQEFKDSEESLIQDVAHNLVTYKVFDHVAPKKKLLIGDSHTPSVWTPEFMIERGDGRTLFGILKNDTVELIGQKFNEAGVSINEIQIYAGNIDIRHHLLRQEQPWRAVQSLAHDLLDLARDLTYTITLTELLPIENESRKLPKTGFYKGTPFFGSWKERSAAVEIFNNILSANQFGISVYKHPRNFYNSDGELTFDVMERPQSVHLSPMHYRWDLENNKMRY